MLVRAPAGAVVLGPAFAPDGSRAYFESTFRDPAPPGREDTDLGVVERTPGGGDAPRPLGAPFDTPYNEQSPTMAADGALCMNSSRPEELGRNDIYCGRVEGVAPSLVTAVSSPTQDAAPWLDRSGRFLLRASNREGGLGGWDLYASCRMAGGWSAPRNLGEPINSAADETGPTLNPGGDSLYFNRRPLPEGARAAVYTTRVGRTACE